MQNLFCFSCLLQSLSKALPRIQALQERNLPEGHRGVELGRYRQNPDGRITANTR